MTIKDLAEKTGYGVATVSRVLNNHPNVSEKARKAILKAVDESGFQINDNAKQLKKQHATSILVVVKGTSNEMFGSLVESIQGEIAKTEYPLLVDYIDEDDNEVLRAVHKKMKKDGYHKSKVFNIYFDTDNYDLIDLTKKNGKEVL